VTKRKQNEHLKQNEKDRKRTKERIRTLRKRKKRKKIKFTGQGRTTEESLYFLLNISYVNPRRTLIKKP
jgi:hypothetical protein